jgi:hypothetical protein
LLDAAERVRGLIVAVGGAQPVTYWYPLPEPALRWPAVLERLLRAPEAPAPSREISQRRGAVHVIPLIGRGAAYVQTTYAWRSDAAPTVARVAIQGAGAAGDSVAFGTFLAEAVGIRLEQPDGNAALTPEQFRARVNELYTAMRDALRKGDWQAFGKAYEDLGRALRAPKPPATPQ